MIKTIYTLSYLILSLNLLKWVSILSTCLHEQTGSEWRQNLPRNGWQVVMLGFKPRCVRPVSRMTLKTGTLQSDKAMREIQNSIRYHCNICKSGMISRGKKFIKKLFRIPSSSKILKVGQKWDHMLFSKTSWKSHMKRSHLPKLTRFKPQKEINDCALWYTLNLESHGVHSEMQKVRINRFFFNL